MTSSAEDGRLDVEQVAAQLREQRALIDVQRRDQRERIRLDREHRESLAEMAEQVVSRKRARRERDRDEVEAAELSALYRRATRSGARARIRADIQRSAEMRALRVALVRKATLWTGVPVLVAFGAWSTAGVQAGVVKLLNLDHGSAGWWAAWAMEPALLTIVAAIIIGRAVLRSSGGDTDWRATFVEWVALLTSLALNMAGGWSGDGWSAVGGALAHSVGPLGAAGTAFLIGLFDGYVTQARPWDGAPRLADMDLVAQPAAAPRTVAAHTGAPVDAPAPQAVTQSGDAPTAATANAAQPAVTRSLARVDATPRRTREVVMRRPVSAPPADRDAALRRAAEEVLAQRASIRGAARDADVPEATLRRHINQLRTVAQHETVNGHSFESAN